MKAIDPLTGEEFIPKKSSQRFATPANRIKYNNEKASKTRIKRAFIDKPLHQNQCNHRLIYKSNGKFSLEF